MFNFDSGERAHIGVVVESSTAFNATRYQQMLKKTLIATTVLGVALLAAAIWMPGGKPSFVGGPANPSLATAGPSGSLPQVANTTGDGNRALDAGTARAAHPSSATSETGSRPLPAETAGGRNSREDRDDDD